MKTLIPYPVLLKTILPYQYLLNAAFFFTVVVAIILLFVLFFLQRYRKQRQRKVQLRALFSDLIAGIAICESEEERQDTLQQFLQEHKPRLQKSFTRNILIREIVKTKDSISGIAAENLQWLYETLSLDRDSLLRFGSSLWYRKASAIQHLAEMQQTKHLVKIYRDTNHANYYIRTEAQIAVVKLTGFNGLRFLNIVSHPVSQWQQLSLISQLQQSEADAAQIAPWLRSENSSVVEFALRLVAIYKCHELYSQTMACLQHASPMVRMQALQAAKEIYDDTTLPRLLLHFDKATKGEQAAILDMLPEIGAGSGEIGFLTTLLQHDDDGIRFRAMQLIQQISPAWSSQVMLHVKDNPSFAAILPLLQKQAV
ncbi:MAG TPA: hypothetical protein VGN63_04910 [Flavisolibacter sp.]|jgi:hypothetical protein|nr:hypothetical protein [Flavisolibacter sp.]